jgi:hypothetical protein
MRSAHAFAAAANTRFDERCLQELAKKIDELSA